MKHPYFGSTIRRQWSVDIDFMIAPNSRGNLSVIAGLVGKTVTRYCLERGH